MAFTYDQILSRALRVVGDSSLTTQAGEWLDSTLLEIESVAFWRFLEASATQATANNDDDYALPSNYSKGLFVLSDEPFVLRQVSRHALEEMKVDGATGNPHFYAIWENQVHVYPKPVTGSLPTLTFLYYKDITLSTTGNDLETQVGIPFKWHKYIIDGVISEGMAYTDDARQQIARAKWEQDLLIMRAENEEYYKQHESDVDRPSISQRPEASQ